MEMEWTWLAGAGGGGLWFGWLVTSLDIWWHVTPHLAPGVTRYFVIKTKTETGPEKKRSRVRIKDIILSSCKQSDLLKSSHVSLVSLNSRNARSGWLEFWCFKMRNIRKSGVGLHVSDSVLILDTLDTEDTQPWLTNSQGWIMIITIIHIVLSGSRRQSRISLMNFLFLQN